MYQAAEIDLHVAVRPQTDGGAGLAVRLEFGRHEAEGRRIVAEVFDLIQAMIAVAVPLETDETCADLATPERPSRRRLPAMRILR